MSGTREILVAVDGSKDSEKVVEQACDLAKKLSSKTVLTYVFPPLDIPEDYIEHARIGKSNVEEYYERVGEAVLSKLAERIKKDGVSVEKLLELGNPASRIVDIAKARNASFIVVGINGLHGIGRIRALGSVARRVIENSSNPVLVVPTRT